MSMRRYIVVILLSMIVFIQYVPVASFASSILSSKDHPSLVIGALQLVDLLLTKLPSLYKPTFHREGVFHEIETLAERTLLSSTKSKEKDGSETNDDALISNPPPTLPGFKNYHLCLSILKMP